MKSHGVTRVCVNPQTMEDHVLAAIGRRHTAADTVRAMELVARPTGFPHREHGPHRRSADGYTGGLPPFSGQMPGTAGPTTSPSTRWR
ncbi:MAG: hypothetical protein ACLU38_10230 [Dysosmobacter sp.]